MILSFPKASCQPESKRERERAATYNLIADVIIYQPGGELLFPFIPPENAPKLATPRFARSGSAHTQVTSYARDKVEQKLVKRNNLCDVERFHAAAVNFNAENAQNFSNLLT
jgi:hypothetical protein